MIRINQQSFRRRDVLLWVAVLLPPVSWLSALEASYMLVHQSCELRSKLLLIGIDVLALAACLLGALIARRVWPEVHDAPEQALEPSRARFMASAGQGLGLFFALVVIAMAIPQLTLRVCD
jgi:hypothetical protein